MPVRGNLRSGPQGDATVMSTFVMEECEVIRSKHLMVRVTINGERELTVNIYVVLIVML